MHMCRNEVKSLEDKVSSAYVKYQSAMKGGGGAEGGASEGSGLSALPLLPVNDQFTLNKDEAWYTLILETQVSINIVHTVYSLSLQVPLDTILLQCNVPIDLQEVEKSTAVISYTPPDPKVMRCDIKIFYYPFLLLLSFLSLSLSFLVE